MGLGLGWGLADRPYPETAFGFLVSCTASKHQEDTKIKRCLQTCVSQYGHRECKGAVDAWPF